MARKQRDEGGGGTWLDTYADMVTLLLTFFVVLLSMSSIEAEKFDVLIRSLTPGDERGVAEPGDSTLLQETPEDAAEGMDDLYKVVQEYIERNDMESMVSVAQEEELIFITFNSQMVFEPDRYTMLEASRPAVAFVGEVLKLYEGKIKNINVCGHTAQTDRVNSDISDWRLSGERAATIAMFMEDECGIGKHKMITFGYGDNYPIASNDTEPGRSQNRRVELVVVGMDSLVNFDVYGVLEGTASEPTPGGGDEMLTPAGAGTAALFPEHS